MQNIILTVIITFLLTSCEIGWQNETDIDNPYDGNDLYNTSWITKDKTCIIQISSKNLLVKYNNTTEYFNMNENGIVIVNGLYFMNIYQSSYVKTFNGSVWGIRTMQILMLQRI